MYRSSNSYEKELIQAAEKRDQNCVFDEERHLGMVLVTKTLGHFQNKKRFEK